ncbi:MAG TPA: TIGR02391 family protein, partial [Terriglobales bacterium]|nr:TIGR02391 family protein [Terriglobales bacterium]
FPSGPPSYLGRHVGFGMDNDYRDILDHDLADVEAAAEEKLLAAAKAQGELGFEGLLHPAIAKAAYQLYRDGHLREAVFNSVVAVFDHVRKLTGIQADGDALVGKALSLNDPYLVLSELSATMRDTAGGSW